MLNADLLPHEFTHSWNGKYRRPVGLATPDYATPMKGDLLWVYEGMTQYWGNVLAARSAYVDTRDLPRGAGLERRPARREARAHLAQPGRHRDRLPDSPWRQCNWSNWRRSQDYYAEGELIWLDADTTIRQLTHGQKSLNDFCLKFLAVGGNTPPKVVPYDFDEIVADLNCVVAYDWRTFLTDRLNSHAAHAPLGGIEHGGYRLIYATEPTEFEQAYARPRQGDRRLVLRWLHGQHHRRDRRCQDGLARLPGWPGPGNQAGGGQRPRLHRRCAQAGDPRGQRNGRSDRADRLQRQRIPHRAPELPRRRKVSPAGASAGNAGSAGRDPQAAGSQPREVAYSGSSSRRDLCSKRFRALLLAALLMPSALLAQSSTLAATPPMGWNSWNLFAGRVTDKDVRAAADAMVSSGMKDAGYIYVNIDDTWQGERDAQGNIQANSKFPDMKALADYVHSKGLKIGIYSGPGPQTCAKYEGSYGHEAQDAKTYAAWGIDYLKYDLCGFRKIMMEQAPNDPAKATQMMKDAYEKMHKALLATGRPIVYSFCQYGWDAVWEWGPSLGANLWRTTGDINPTWDRMTLIGFSQAGLAKYAGPGHWNDPDMLEVGNGKLTLDENRTAHEPMGDAGRSAAGGQRSFQDAAGDVCDPDQSRSDRHRSGSAGQAGRSCFRGRSGGDLGQAAQGWRQGRSAFQPRRHSAARDIEVERCRFYSSAKARDIWASEGSGQDQGSYTVTVPRHGVVLLRLTK